MFIHRTQIFLAAANPALHQAAAGALNELTAQVYTGLGELGRRGLFAENPHRECRPAAEGRVGWWCSGKTHTGSSRARRPARDDQRKAARSS